ncbi:MAG: hypothetical protein ABL995_00345 [Bryobacteraceae bacterium]
MREFMNAMVRFSAALTAFGWHQTTIAIAAPAQMLGGVRQIKEAMDAASEVLRDNVDEGQKQVFSSIVGVSTGLVARTVGMVDASLFDPSRIVQTTMGIARSTTDTLLGSRS